MQVIFFTEGGKNLGLGHLSRCAALAQAFSRKGIPGKFVVAGDSSVIGMAAEYDVELIDWVTADSLSGKYLAGDGIAVIDSYSAPLQIYRHIQQQAGLGIYLDDFNRLPYPAGIVVNGALEAARLSYPGGDRMTYLLGPEFQPLRQPFERLKNKTQRPAVEKILITCGGSDPHHLMPALLKFLSPRYTGLQFIALIGESFQDQDRLQRLAGNNIQLSFSPAADQLPDLMRSCDIAISAAGQTLYELAAVGLPPIVVGVAENQQHNISGWLKTGFIEFAGWWNNQNLLESIQPLLEKLIADAGLRRQKSELGQQLVDGLGSRRIVERVLQYGRTD